MPPVERLRQILPFAAAVYLAASVAQLQPNHAAPRGPAVEELVSGLKWHMLEMARNEQAKMIFAASDN